jgi:RNA recognition motif-containing protein
MSISHDVDYATAVCLSYEGRSSGIGESEAQRTERERNARQRIRRVVGYTEKSTRVFRTVFLGGISPQTSITDLEEAFSGYSKSVKAYLYQTESGALLGTGAIVMETVEDAAKARAEMDKTTLQGNTIRCVPFLRKGYRKFLQRVVRRDAVYLKSQQELGTDPVEPVKEEIQKELEPKPLFEPEPLPQPSSPQYILVKEMFRIQEEYQERRARGVFVGNVPLEATDDDLQKLFAHISNEVKGRIRRTSSGRHLESGYVSFPTAEDAAKARETMSGTILLGKAITCGPIALREMSPSKKEPKFGGV